MINNSSRDYTDYTLGVGAGYLSYKGAKKIGAKIRKPYVNEVMTQMQNFSSAEKEILKQATYDGFVQSGLKAKKYYLHDVKPENAENMRKLINRKCENSRLIKKLRKLQGNRRPLTPEQKIELQKKLSEHLKNGEYKKFWQEVKNAGKVQEKIKPSDIKSELREVAKPAEEIKNKIDKIVKSSESSSVPNKIIKSSSRVKLAKKLKDVAEGKNAFCSPLTRDIMINVDKLGGASFHEMGHALNASGSKVIKALAIGRHISALFVPVILAIGLLKPKKKDNEEPNGIIDKATTFIKSNAGKLTFAALIPTLAEEGLASIRGGQIAKKVLDPKLLKKVNRNNFLAWTTYLTGALLTTGAVTIGVKIRDAIAEK